MRIDTEISLGVGPVEPHLGLGRTRRERARLFMKMMPLYLKDKGIMLRPVKIAEAERDKFEQILCIGQLDPRQLYYTLDRIIVAEGMPVLPMPEPVLHVLDGRFYCPDFVGVINNWEELLELQNVLYKWYGEA